MLYYGISASCLVHWVFAIYALGEGAHITFLARAKLSVQSVTLFSLLLCSGASKSETSNDHTYR